MVTNKTVLNAISRGVSQSGRLPEGTNYLTRQPDPEGTDGHVRLPAVVIQEVSTVRDDSQVTDLVGYVTDDEGSRVGRIWQASYSMEVQIDVHTVSGATPPRDIDTLEPAVKRALQRYDSQIRGDVFPDGEGGSIGSITGFTLSDSTPQNDLTQNHSLIRQRLSATVNFVDRIDEVEEYGAIPTIKGVITPQDGDFVGLSDDYTMEFHPTLDSSSDGGREPEFNVTTTA